MTALLLTAAEPAVVHCEPNPSLAVRQPHTTVDTSMMLPAHLHAQYIQCIKTGNSDERSHDKHHIQYDTTQPLFQDNLGKPVSER